ASRWLEPVTQLPTEWLLGAVLVASAQVLISVRLTLWQVRGCAVRYGAFQLSQSTLNACVSVLAVVALGMAWHGRLLGQATAAISFGCLAIWWMRSDIIRPARAAHVKDALRYGIPLIPHVIGGLMIIAAD